MVQAVLEEWEFAGKTSGRPTEARYVTLGGQHLTGTLTAGGCFASA